ncbi:hypothetical protein CDD81_6551 [Ophiocordyceps australis]|uniref:Zn(2)-C6 fungal-type domain-containing protein n=1 Tax=Ophiocordyceps australis TaxID=1399860 RepID=A0A2C5XHL1_9HYPO|nr:hypothetical protein CDD81_6551 [Ophiocordyceps australis]
MSSGPSRMALDQQVPHGQQHFYPQRDASALHDTPNAMMDSSQPYASDFSFPFSGSHMMNIGYDEPGFSQHHVASSLVATSHPMVPASSTSSSMAAVAAFRAESENHRSSPATSEADEGVQLENSTSPTCHSVEDRTADEFGLGARTRADGTDLGAKTKDDRSGGNPSWSELKTKAGKDRKRLPLACIACRRKKIRCSGEKPACKHCLRSRIPCVYKVTTRKAAPRTDYMAMLDKRLKRMEERIIKIIPKTDHQDASTPPVTRAVVKPALPGAASGPGAKSAASKKRGADEAFGGPDLEAWAKAPYSTSQMPENCDAASLTEAQGEEEDRLFREGMDALPSKEIQEHLAEVFFDYVYGQAYHLLHKPSYMRKLKNNTLPPVLVLSVCAVAARFTPNSSISPTQRQFLRGEEWASRARDICTRRYEWPNMTILTCLLILGLHEFGTCHGGRSWALGGQAIRMAFALQLHKDLEYDPLCRSGDKTRLSFIDREIRRRIMWACFLMDRFNSSGSDRPMFVKEESIKIQLPVAERYFQLDMPVRTECLDGSIGEASQGEEQVEASQARANMGVAAYTIRSIAIWGRIITYLNQGGKEADAHPMWSADSDYARLVEDIEELVRTLPASFQYTAENLELQITDNMASQYLLLHLSIQQNRLFISQAAVTFANSRAGAEAPTDFLAQVSGKTFAAANAISDLVRDAEQGQCCVTAPFAGYCAFSSTTIHIMGIFSGNAGVKATAEANSGANIRFLRKMMRYWGMFHWMVENIRMQYRNALATSRSGKSASDCSPLMLQYGDWFDRYPHGVSDSDLTDPTVQRRKERGEDAVLEQKPELQSVQEFFTTLSPPRTADARNKQQRAPPAKRPQTQPPSDKEPLPPADSAMTTKMGLGHSSSVPQLPRKYSHSMASAPPSGFSPLTMAPQSQPAPQPYASLSPVSPFGQQPGAQNVAFFSADMLSMNLSHQPNEMLPQQSLERHMPFADFVDSPTRPQGQMSAPLSAPPHTPHHDSSHGFPGPDWFMPLGLATPDATQPGLGIAPTGIDPFSNMFGNTAGGIMTPTQLDALRHPL